MTAATLIKTNAGGEYEWLELANGAQNSSHGDVEQLVESSPSGNQLIFIAPTENTLLREVSYDSSEKSMYRKTIPYTLEDDIVDDVEDLHFAFGAPTDNTVMVAAVNRQGFEEWLEDFNAGHVELQQLVPESLLLPHHSNGWTLLVDGDRWLVRCSESNAIAFEKDTAILALQLMLDESEELPERLYLYTTDTQHEDVIAQLPELLKGIVEWNNQDYWDVLANSFESNNAGLLNMLQGEYAQSLPYMKWLNLWKKPLILFAIVLVVQLVGGFANQYLLKQENTRLRAEIESIYRTVVPRGAVVDAERQLKKKVAGLKGGSSEGFVTLLDRCAKVLMGTQGLTIKNLNYNERQSEIRLTILVPSFKDVEAVRIALEQKGLNAQMTGSNQDGDKVRAGLKIRG